MAEAPPPNYSLQGAWAATNPPDSSTGMFVGTDVSSDVTVGFGIFGLKRERTLVPHVTGYDASRPRSRRVAVGVRLKF